MGWRGTCDGPSDSLKFFRQAVGRGGNIFEAIEALKAQVALGEYRAMNFLLTDGKKIRAWRDWNESNPDAETLGLDAYYGLFRAESSSAQIVSSEPLTALGLQFAPIENGSSLDLA